MKYRNLAIGFVVASFAVSAGSTTAFATPSCTPWMDQNDGTQHCYKISNAKGSIAYEVSCSK